MKNKSYAATLAGLVTLGGVWSVYSMGYASTLAPQPSPPAIPSNFANEAFKNTWMRTDALVDSGAVKRSYYWGPVPGFSTFEDFAEGTGGRHQVQYFDKSRMEINYPAGDKNDPFYVTNGLLTRELISGQMQVGEVKFVTRYPAQIDIASDTDDTGTGTPTYASFQFVLGGTYNRTGVPTGAPVNATIARSGPDYSGLWPEGHHYVYYEPATRHNIPDVFWDFLNQTGPVMVNGKVTNARLSDPYFYATGYPITEAYWARVKIAGVPNTDVLIQPYERRVLTYVPSAPEGFKVQMGNIGQHYYDWLYKNAGSKPPPTPVPTITPTPGPCSQPPTRGFGKVWTANPGLRSKLGCPYRDEQPMTVIYQPFEHGSMVERFEVFAHSGGYTTVRTAYVLFSDGTAQGFPINYPEGQPEPNLAPPSGLYAPRHDLAILWQTGSTTRGVRVRDLLGWATAPETRAESTQPLPPLPPEAIPTVTVLPTVTASPVPPGQPTPVPGGGAYQAFERGIMLYTGPVSKKILALFSSSSGGYGVNGAQVFDDTFVGP